MPDSSSLPQSAKLVLVVEFYGYNFQLVDPSGNNLLMGRGYDTLAECVQVIVTLQNNAYAPGCFRRFPGVGPCYYFVMTDKTGKVQASSAMYFSEEDCERGLLHTRRELKHAELMED